VRVIRELLAKVYLVMFWDIPKRFKNESPAPHETIPYKISIDPEASEITFMVPCQHPDCIHCVHINS